MKHRGKILRDTNTGPGLLSSDGTQHPFSLETHWKSDLPPKVGMVVDVTLDGAGSLAAVMPVAESQLAREQAELAMQAAKARGGALAASLRARFGLATLFAMTVLLLGWFVLNSITVQLSSHYSTGMSFWKLLGVLNAPDGLIDAFNGGSSGSGIYGFMCVVALVAPLAPQVWNDRRAHLGGVLPLAFMLFVALMIYLGINDGLKQAQGAAGFLGGAQAARMAESLGSMMLQNALRAISIGAGVYLSLLASLFLAGRGAMKFLAAKA